MPQAEKLPTLAPAPAPPDELQQLGIRIRVAHKDVVAAASNMILKAMEAGALLLQAKEKVPRNTWMAWLQENCSTVSDRTARLYIQLATGREVIEANMKTGLATVANPTFTQALGWLKTDTDTKSEATAGEAKAGKSKKPAEVYRAKQEELIDALRELSSPDHAEEYALKTKGRLDETIAAWRKEA
jgi:Protein of unknown function (DUF3102)